MMKWNLQISLKSHWRKNRYITRSKQYGTQTCSRENTTLPAAKTLAARLDDQPTTKMTDKKIDN